MKTLCKYSGTLLLLTLLVAAWSSKAENPGYTCIARNGALLNSKVFQFDIYIYQTGSVPLHLNNYQLAFTIQNTAAITNGGNITASYVAGSSELNGFVPTGINITLINGQRIFRINGPVPGRADILIPPAGLKLGTFRIMNTAEYGQSSVDLAWTNSGPYKTRVYGVTDGSAREITDFPAHLICFANVVGSNPSAANPLCQCTAGIEEGPITPGYSDEAIVRNYPNPFSEMTTLLFVLPSDNHVTLGVYDLSGKLIQSLYNGEVNKYQEYSVAFNGSYLANGIYIYKMTTDNEVVTGKMMLNRE